jgi:hypothetical protein
MIMRPFWLATLCLLAFGPRLSAQPGPPAATTSPLGEPPDWNLLTTFARTLSDSEFTDALKAVYLEPTHYPTPWIISPEGVKIQTGDPINPTVTVPFASRIQPKATPSRFWRRAADLPPIANRPPLTDLHIAIDPGHIGGSYGIMEERRLSFQAGEAIQEGDLALLTAQVLAARLKALGAYVTLVRDQAKPVTPSKPTDFRLAAIETLRQSGFPDPTDSYQGVQGDAKLLTIQWQSEKLFYRVAEIHARADRVNREIKPDVVLCLHFNAESWGDAADPQYSPVNHAHILVNGCYAPSELADHPTRFEMFTRLFSRIHEEEIPLAKALASSLAASTGLPPYSYKTPNALPIPDSPYLFARNLLANRLYQCPVIFFEPYVMNHKETYQRLLRGHWIGRTLIDDSLQTSPIEDYVQGIVSGLLSYYQTHRPA